MLPKECLNCKKLKKRIKELEQEVEDDKETADGVREAEEGVMKMTKKRLMECEHAGERRKGCEGCYWYDRKE